jgi:hypothetical protein
MLGADTFISALLRVVTTVAVLAAFYFFIVKPILHTTETVSHSFNHSPAIQSAQRAIREAGVNPARIRHKIRVSVRQATHRIKAPGIPKEARHVLACIRRADGNVQKIQACGH